MLLNLLLCPQSAIAQIIPDSTLPIPSTVEIQNNINMITGGTTAGSNLFHSFEQFSLPTGREAYFNNALEIDNIMMRVTGTSISEIDGLIRANGVANLFLLNPNGIVFGPNARLNIGGSFFASTAESLIFEDGALFSATEAQTPPLLTVNVPIGLQLGQTPGTIINSARSTNGNGEIVGLAVQPGQTIALIGGEVLLEGGTVRSPSGRTSLVSGTDGQWQLGNGVFQSNSDNNGNSSIPTGKIELSGEALVDASGPGGGAIQLYGSNIILTEGSGILSDTFGDENGQDITIEANQFLLNGDAFIGSRVFGSGDGGNISLRAVESVEAIGIGFDSFAQGFIVGTLSGDVRIFEQLKGIFTLTAGLGNAGNINIETENFTLQNGIVVYSSTVGLGNGGSLTVQGADVVEIDTSLFVSLTLSPGDAGNITISTDNLGLRNQGIISAATIDAGAGGDVTIDAKDTIEIVENSPGSSSILSTFIITSSVGTGPAGNITINARNLRLLNGGGIVASSGGFARGIEFPSGGQGGNLEINVSESVEIVGVSADGVFDSLLSTATFTDANAGDLTITTDRFRIVDGATVNTSTRGSGKGGNLIVRANQSVEAIGTSLNGDPTGLFTSSGGSEGVLTATGAGGNLVIFTGELIVRDGAEIDVSSIGSGDAGVLEVVADSLRLDRGGMLNAATVSGAGGNIQLKVPQIILRRGSNINTNAANSNGGNITIYTQNLVALENSDITANAQVGFGGLVRINAQGIFGPEFEDEITPKSDITATSELGDGGFSGIVDINTPEVDTEFGLMQLPENLLSVTELVTLDLCSQGKDSEFLVTGRGGLPPTPGEVLQISPPWIDWRFDVGVEQNPREESEFFELQRNHNQHLPDRHLPIIEAQGWRVGANGQVILTATAPELTVENAWPTASICER